MLSTNYSFGVEHDEEVLAMNDFDHRKWTNPLEIRYVGNGYPRIASLTDRAEKASQRPIDEIHMCLWAWKGNRGV